MPVRIASVVCALGILLSLCSTQARLDQGVTKQLDEQITSLEIDTDLIAGLQQVWGQSLPTVREVIQTKRSILYNLPRTPYDSLHSKAPYPGWVGRLQRKLAERNLSLEMTNQDINDFLHLPQRTIFRGLRSFEYPINITYPLLVALEEQGVYTVYDLFKIYPTTDSFVAYVRELSKSRTSIYFTSLNSPEQVYAVLSARHRDEIKQQIGRPDDLSVSHPLNQCARQFAE